MVEACQSCARVCAQKPIAILLSNTPVIADLRAHQLRRARRAISFQGVGHCPYDSAPSFRFSSVRDASICCADIQYTGADHLRGRPLARRRPKELPRAHVHIVHEVRTPAGLDGKRLFAPRGFHRRDRRIRAMADGTGLLLTRRKNGRHVPPGPKPLPFIGNALQIPPQHEWIKFKEWGDTYGDLVKVEIPGNTFYFINTRDVATELLEARSAIYCSRPRAVMASISGWKNSIPTLEYGPRLRESRKMLKKGMGPAAVKTYYPYINREVPFFLENMLRKPDSFVEHFNRNAARIALKIAYGYEGVTEDEKIIRGGVDAMEVFSAVAAPGVWVVDTFPFLKYVPSWFPFAKFKKFAERGKKITDEALDTPFYEVKRRVENGTADGSFTTVMLQTEKSDPETEDIIKWAATGIFTGQFDTTTATLSWFTLAMAKYPEVQKKAQAEIDRVIGKDRLPEVGDRDSLPYVWAIMQETFRWHPTITMMPHTAIQDDEYRGYFIPSGTTLMANIWGILHDEKLYHDADKFIPERFCDEGAPDSLSVAFGFGRRVCPGLVIAQTHVFVTMASMLATFNITKARDSTGAVIEPREDAKSGVINFPKPFVVSITPRSDEAVTLIRRSVEHSKTLPDRLEIFST